MQTVIYDEAMVREVCHECVIGIRVVGKVVNLIRNADDKAVVAMCLRHCLKNHHKSFLVNVQFLNQIPVSPVLTQLILSNAFLKSTL